MNILTETLPTAVTVNGGVYSINTDFRAGIKFETMIQQCEKNPVKLLQPFFGEYIPSDIKAAIREIHLFYCCGSIPEKKDGTQPKKRAYSFEADASAIMADFWRYYGINLAESNMHWWVFSSLLENLPTKSEFKQRVHYRICDLKGLHKKERERVLKIRSQIEIKSTDSKKITLEERNQSMIDYLAMRRKETSGGG